jgi:transcription-repair coupling factor (superfamily II helicase)
LEVGFKMKKIVFRVTNVGVWHSGVSFFFDKNDRRTLAPVSNLQHLLQAYRDHPAVKKIAQNLENQTLAIRIQLNGLVGAQESFVLAATSSQRPTPKVHLFIANSKEEAAYRHNDLEGLLTDQAIYFFPDSFKRPAFFDDLSAIQILQRSEAVSKMTLQKSEKTILVTYPEALFEKVVRPEVLAKDRIEIKKGEKLDADWVIEVLVEYGFERADFVHEPGQFSIRGGIIDLFSFGNDLPYRIELFDDEVETIRVFDPLTQLSQKSLSSLSIVPNLNTRFRQDQKVSLFQILPENTVIWIKDFQFLLDRLQYCFERAEQFASKLTALDSAELREIFRDRAFLFPGDVAADVAEHPLVFLEGKVETLRKSFPELF